MQDIGKNNKGYMKGKQELSNGKIIILRKE
jgi:hypothetical protein